VTTHRLKHFLERNDGGCWGDDPTGIDDTVVLRSTEQSANGDWRIADPAVRHVPASERKSKTIDLDDIIITKSSGSADHIGKASIADQSIAELEAVYSNFMQRIRVNRNASPRYVWHLLNSSFARNHYNVYATSTSGLGNLNGTIVGNLAFPIPDLATQRQIADFLDRETARIDLLIEKKQRLVALLGEKWESVVESAISTGGKRTKLGHHIDILSGYAFPSSDFSTDPDDMPLLRGANVSPGSIRWDDAVYWSRERLGEVSRFLLDAGDVVLGMDRPWISSGIRVAELTEKDAPALLLQRVCRIAPRKTLEKQFMKLLLTSRQFLAYFEPIMTGVSVPHISPDQVSSFRFEYVDREEQVMRATAAVKERDRITRVQSSTEKSIDRLKEYRAALITAAVTGQIDVETYAKSGTPDRHLDAIQEEMGA